MAISHITQAVKETPKKKNKDTGSNHQSIMDIPFYYCFCFLLLKGCLMTAVENDIDMEEERVWMNAGTCSSKNNTNITNAMQMNGPVRAYK